MQLGTVHVHVDKSTCISPPAECKQLYTICYTMCRYNVCLYVCYVYYVCMFVGSSLDHVGTVVNLHSHSRVPK